MKRNLIEEIVSVKGRLCHNSRYSHLNELQKLDVAVSRLEEDQSEFGDQFLKYLPIGTVACFEAFFKAAIAEMIDYGPPFSDNIRAYNQAKNVKLDFDVISAIQRQLLTVGEFVGHILSFNNLEDINANISTLIGGDFLDGLRTFRKETIFEIEKQTQEYFTSNFGEILAAIKRTYQIRHIFCHEFATTLRVERAELLADFDKCKVFLTVSNRFISDLIYPNAHETQADMNQRAFDELAKIEDELNALIDTIINVEKSDMNDMDVAIFLRSIDLWKHYREARAEANASVVLGGSAYPTVYSMNMATITKEKVESLRDEYRSILIKDFAG